MTLVSRTIFIDQATDQVLAALAAGSGLAKADVFRSRLNAGIKRVRKGLMRPMLSASALHLVLKTVYIDAKTNDGLRMEAFDRHVLADDVLREYLQAGLKP